MAQHKLLPYANLDHYRIALQTAHPGQWAKEDVQYLMDVIDEKEAELAMAKSDALHWKEEAMAWRQRQNYKDYVVRNDPL